MDLFVEQNFLMNLIVLSLTQIFCNPNGKKNYIRMILAAFLGAVLSVCVLVIGSFYVYVAVAAIILVPFMLVIAFGRQNGRQMIRFMLVSWLSIVIVNGIVSIGCQWTGTQGIPWYLAILTLCIARILVRNLVNNLQRQTKFLQVVLTNHGRNRSCIGLYDSGNRLQMPDTGEPGHIVGSALLRELGVGEETQKLIPYRALGRTDGVIGVVKVEKMKVMSGRKVYCGEGVWMGCADDALLQGMDYEMILNGAIRFG